MSGGQRQAVAIARTRLNRLRIVLMDEPTTAIGVRQIEQVLALIRRSRDQGVAVILISYRMPDVFGVADRVVVFRHGEKVADRVLERTSPEEDGADRHAAGHCHDGPGTAMTGGDPSTAAADDTTSSGGGGGGALDPIFLVLLTALPALIRIGGRSTGRTREKASSSGEAS